MQISAKIDIDDVIQILSPEKQILCVRNLVNRIGGKAYTIMKTAVYKKINLRKKQIVIHRKKATPTHLSNEYTANLTPIALSKFKTRKIGRGLDVYGWRDRSPIYIEGGFVAQPSGRDWRKWGQSKSMTTPWPLVFVSLHTYRSYSLAVPGSRKGEALVDVESLPAVGKIMSSGQTKQDITTMIDRDGPAMLQSEFNYLTVHKRVLDQV